MFILLEGIDGAGKGHQRNNLVQYLQGKVNNLVTVDFPDHNGALYQHLIHPAIHEEIKMSSESLFLSFALDQSLWQDRIEASLTSKDEYFITDGYFTTAIVYQCIMGEVITIDEALTFARTFGIHQPDFAVYIDVDPEVAMKRKMIEEGHDEGLDIFERDIEKQQKIRAGFKHLVKNNIFGNWVEVDGNESIEDVFAQITDALNKHKII